MHQYHINSFRLINQLLTFTILSISKIFYQMIINVYNTKNLYKFPVIRESTTKIQIASY